MVEEVHRHALQQVLNSEQYSSADSSPLRLSHPLPYRIAPRLVAGFAILSFALILVFNNVPLVAATFPEHDLYFSRYPGRYNLPMRLFIVSFCIAFAFSIDARWSVRARFCLDLTLAQILFFGTLDLSNVLANKLFGLQISLPSIGLASALGGMLIFVFRILRCADMPARSDSPMNIRFKIGSLLTLMLAISVAGATSIWVDYYDTQLVRDMRGLGLIGGVNVGIFLFLPLLNLLLNLVAAFQKVYRRTPSFAPDVTAILPAYNEAHVIASSIAALDTAAANYRGKVTLLVVDNNSTDLTRSVASSAFATAKHLNCTLLEAPERGKAHALNRGLDAVETDYFARVDSDTILEPEALSRAFSHFGRKHVGVVGGLAVPPGGGPFDGAREIESLLKMGYDQVAFGAADCIIGIPGMFACYDTQAARQAGGFAHGINGEDTDMSVRIGENGYRLIADPTVIYLSEVPRTFAHMREQRHRWFRSLFHVTSRNRQFLEFRRFSVRGAVVLPFMLTNTARRAMAFPLLIFAINFLVLHPDERSTIQAVSVLALLLGTPMVNSLIAVLVNFRLSTVKNVPSYLLFRMLRAYLTLEALLSMNYTTYSARGWMPWLRRKEASPPPAAVPPSPAPGPDGQASASPATDDPAEKTSIR